MLHQCHRQLPVEVPRRPAVVHGRQVGVHRLHVVAPNRPVSAHPLQPIRAVSYVQTDVAPSIKTCR